MRLPAWYWRDGSVALEGGLRGIASSGETAWSEKMREIDARLRDPAYKVVARTAMSTALVSTVWLGLDHNFCDDGSPPLIFETLIFSEDPELNGKQWRYATEAEAAEGHLVAVTLVRECSGPVCRLVRWARRLFRRAA
jgi:hypothetical protein